MTSEAPLDNRAIVLALLQLYGLTPSPDEVDAFAAGYATSRAMVAPLYALPGVRYAEPAVTFDPRVTP